MGTYFVEMKRSGYGTHCLPSDVVSFPTFMREDLNELLYSLLKALIVRRNGTSKSYLRVSHTECVRFCLLKTDLALGIFT